MSGNMEKWLPVPGYPGYEVSESGRVRSPYKELKHVQIPSGHLQVGLYKDGKAKTHGVQKVVCMAFHADTYFPGAYALHKDSNPVNCHKDNLYWGTQTQNGKDMVEAGNFKTKAENHGMAKLNWAKVRELRQRVKSGEPVKKLALEFGIHAGTAFKIISGKLWKE